MIIKEDWNQLDPQTSPFVNFEFFNALIQSGCIGGDSGWEPVLLTHHNAGLLTFKKMHSYGEYIFDWAWADAYERYGQVYYPKLTSMIPFTPVTTPHFMMKDFNLEQSKALLKIHDELLMELAYSSAHFLFLEKKERELFKEHGYFLRESLQYHFINPSYLSFENFLNDLKPKKVKTIKKERVFHKIQIRRVTGDELNEVHAQRMFYFYQLTIANKQSFSYLNELFFQLVFKTMKDNILYVEATKNEKPIAGALFFFDTHKLYGRYWGCDEFVPNLHFELCYYQGIDFCIERGLKVFEAGAQGEHKIPRGFRPTVMYSAHKLKNSSFHQAILDFNQKEKKLIQRRKAELETLLPFKQGC